MAEERTYTEKELEEMANLLLADEEPAPEVKPKKKAAAKGKKEPAPEQPVKTPEERLNELVEKGKKNGAATPLPRGKIDYVKIVKALIDVGYHGVCALEYERDFTDNLAPIAESAGYFRGLVDALTA